MNQISIQVARLLTDTAANNQALVLELVSGQGAPAPEMRGYVFGIAVFTHDRAIRLRALDVLGRMASEQTVQDARRLYESVHYHFDDAAFFSRWRNPELDPLDVLLAYKMCNWHRRTRPDTTFAAIAHQSLNLSAYELPALTPAIEAFHFVRYIWLPAHTGFDLNGALPHLQQMHLESIYLENNKIPRFPVELFSLPHLKTLSIRKGKHRPRNPTRVPDGGLWGSASLENLILEGYPLAGEEHMGPFPALREADVQRCGLHNMQFLHRSPLLERIRLRGNQLRELPPFLGELTHLRELDLTENPWQVLNLNLTGLGALEKFHLSK